jgi:hypothetical protein
VRGGEGGRQRLRSNGLGPLLPSQLWWYGGVRLGCRVAAAAAMLRLHASCQKAGGQGWYGGGRANVSVYVCVCVWGGGVIVRRGRCFLTSLGRTIKDSAAGRPRSLPATGRARLQRGGVSGGRARGLAIAAVLAASNSLRCGAAWCAVRAVGFRTATGAAEGEGPRNVGTRVTWVNGKGSRATVFEAAMHAWGRWQRRTRPRHVPRRVEAARRALSNGEGAAPV